MAYHNSSYSRHSYSSTGSRGNPDYLDLATVPDNGIMPPLSSHAEDEHLQNMFAFMDDLTTPDFQDSPTNTPPNAFSKPGSAVSKASSDMETSPSKSASNHPLRKYTSTKHQTTHAHRTQQFTHTHTHTHTLLCPDHFCMHTHAHAHTDVGKSSWSGDGVPATTSSSVSLTEATSFYTSSSAVWGMGRGEEQHLKMRSQTADAARLAFESSTEGT